MESKTCENCSKPVFAQNMYLGCKHKNITCKVCLVATHKECPYCKAHWKTKLSKENEVTKEISDKDDYILDCSINCNGNLIVDSLTNPQLIMKVSISDNGAKVKRSKASGHIKARLSLPACRQFDPNKIYDFQFANEKSRKKFEAMNSFKGEKQKLQVVNVTSSIINNLPTENPSLANKRNLIFNKLSSNEALNVSPYQASTSSPRKNKRRQELISSAGLYYSTKASETGSRRLKSSITTPSLLRQQAKELFIINEPKNKKSDENIFMVLAQPQKKERSLRAPSNKNTYIRNANLNTAVKIIRKEDECSKMRRLRREQIIAEEKTIIRQRILQDMQNKLLEDNYKKISNTSGFLEGCVHIEHSIEGKDIKQGSYRKKKCNKTTAKRIEQEVKSSSEMPSSDMISKKNSYVQVLQEEFNLNFNAPKGFINHSDSQNTSSQTIIPLYKLMQQRNYDEDYLLRELSLKSDVILDREGSQKTNSTIGSPTWEVAVLSPTSEKSYDKYGLSRTVQRTYKDSTTEPIPSCYFEARKLNSPCSCDKIYKNKTVLSKSNHTQTDDIKQKKSSCHVDVETNKLKSNTNIKSNLKKQSRIEDLPSKKKNRKSVTINTNSHEKQTRRFEIGDYDREEMYLEKELETFINTVCSPNKTINNLNDLVEVLTINDDDSIPQKSKSKNSINDELPPSEEIDTKEIENSESNVFTATNRLTNSWQAFCPSFARAVKGNSEPIPQIRNIETRYVNDEIIRLQQIHSLAQLNTNRNPLNCPITTCKCKVLISDFAKHIKLNHIRIPIETITPTVCKNLYFDCKLIRSGLSSCQILYLVTNKIRDFGSHEFRDFLPVLLMTTKASLFDLLSDGKQHNHIETARNMQYYYFIWLTGFVIKEVPVYYTLVAWNRNAAQKPGCHVVNAGKLYSFRENQSAKQLYDLGEALVLSQDQCNMLTDYGKNMLELQIFLH